MTRVWVNATFGSVHHALRLLRANVEGHRYEILGTHVNPASPVLAACDFAELEPEIEGEDYGHWAVDFCRINSIDVVVPKRELVALCRRAPDLRANGTLLLASDAAVVEVLSSKSTMYETAGRLGLRVPRCSTVSTVDDFMAAVSALQEADLVACVKPAVGAGGEGFRVIMPEAAGIGSLYECPSHGISLQEIVRILSSVPSFEPLVVSEFLPGPEYSIDCLGDDGDLLLSVVRVKGGGGSRRIVDRPDLVDFARRVTEGYGLRSLFNVQVRGDGAAATLLEVNPRLSAGIHQSSLGGANLLHAAIQLARFGTKPLPVPFAEIPLVTVTGAVRQRVLRRPARARLLAVASATGSGLAEDLDAQRSEDHGNGYEENG